MRYSSEHKAETRSRIIKSAAREIRLKGPDNVAVTELMASAGLTHGGFYAHFASKDALVAEAVDVMFADAQRGAYELDKTTADEELGARSELRDFLAGYISQEHRDRPDRGCPLPALSSDMARNSGEARTRFAIGLEKLTSKIAVSLENIGITNPGFEANAVVSQMVGALVLARAIGKGTQSDAILRNTLASLTTRLNL